MSTKRTPPIKELLVDTGSAGFLNLPDHYDIAASKAVIIPFGLEKTVSYATGTAAGPAAVIAASHEVELYDPHFGREPYSEFGIATLKQFPVPADHGESLALLGEIVAALLHREKFPVVLGGEHSLLGGSAQGLHKVFGKKCNLLHFDAHTDLRPEFEGNPLSHASAMHLALPYVNRIVQIGIRNTSLIEQPVIRKLQKENRIKIYTAEEIVLRKKPRYIEEILRFLHGGPVYLTFDVDALDMSIIGSSTGTPEPGGLYWYETLNFLRIAASALTLVGAEFVEMLPRKENPAPDFAVAKLIYKFLCAVHATRKTA